MCHRYKDDGSSTTLPENANNANSTPALSELSQRDKPWDKHRKNADTIANYYRATEEYDQYSSRMDFCSQLLDFRMVMDDEAVRLKLSNIRFCRVRNCPVCQWRRSLMWKAKAFKIKFTN